MLAALVDAAILYGAQRILSGRHDDETWIYRDRFHREDDERLFREFLHQIVLFDELYIDRSSLGVIITDEIQDLTRRVNKAKRSTVEIKVFDASSRLEADIERIKRSYCQFLGAQISVDTALRYKLLQVPVPWAYRTDRHNDYGSILNNIQKVGLSEDLLPFILFSWRALVYGAIAQAERRGGREISAYIAAPGRMAALQCVLRAEDIHRFQFTREAWKALIWDLPTLEPQGYDFSFLGSLPASDTSDLAAAISELQPDEALTFAIDWRGSPEGHALRADWADLLEAELESVILGSTNIQIAKNITTEQFTQMIVARPRRESVK